MTVRLTAEQIATLAEIVERDGIECVDAHAGKDGRVTFSAVEFVERRRRLALKPGKRDLVDELAPQRLAGVGAKS